MSYVSGFALTDNGLAQASMGIAAGDYNRDGRLDFYVTAFSDDFNTLYRNDGNVSFSEVGFQASVSNITIPFLGWGTGFLDFDNDGLLDLFVANGHIYRWVDERDWGTTWAQRPLLFRNVDGTKFAEVPPATGSGLAAVIPARGAAFLATFSTMVLPMLSSTIWTRASHAPQEYGQERQSLDLAKAGWRRGKPSRRDWSEGICYDRPGAATR